MPVDEKRKSLIEWSRHSLVGHLVVYQICMLPFLFIFLGLNYYDGYLTIGWAFYTLFLAVSGGLFLGLVSWYVLLPSLKKKYGKKS